MPAFDKFTYQGEPFRGEFTAVDPSTQVLNTEPGHRFSLFVAGSTVAITLATGDRAMISDWVITSASADTFYIYDGADINADVGERPVNMDIGPRRNNVRHLCGLPWFVSTRRLWNRRVS